MDQQQIQEIWPGWETVRLIGSGSYGSVYEIRRQLGYMEESAAVKWLSIPKNPGDLKELRASGYTEEDMTRHFSEMKNKLVMEYGAMVRLKGSTNVVYCDDIRTQRQADGIGWDVFIKMELLTPLMDVLGSGTDEKQVLELGMDIARALASCHREKVLHRDVKPQNIFVNREGSYKLGDFGVARFSEGTANASVRTGTYGYMAPEVFNGSRYGPRADLYSLGLVLYWLLNERRLPFLPMPPQMATSEEESQARARRFRGEELLPPAHGSKGLKSIVMKACAYDPQDRYESASDMLRDLEWLRMGRPISAAAPRKERFRPEIPDDGNATRGVFDSEVYRRKREDSRQGQSGRQDQQDGGSDRWNEGRREQNGYEGQGRFGGGFGAQQRQEGPNRQGGFPNRQGQPGYRQEQQRQQYGGQDPQQRQYGGPDPQRRQYGGQDPQQRQYGGPDPQRRQYGGQDPQQRQYGGQDPQRRQSGSRDPQRQQYNRQEQQKQQSNRQEQQRQQSNRQDQLWQQFHHQEQQRQQSNRQGKGFWSKPSDRGQNSSRHQQNGQDDQQWSNYYQAASYDVNQNPYWGDDIPYSGSGADDSWGAGPESYDFPGQGGENYGASYGSENESASWGDFGWPDDMDY